MDLGLDGKVILVTGAASGIGRATAEALELAEQIVERLLAQTALRGQLRRAQLVGSRPLQDAEVRSAEVGEAALVQACEQSLVRALPRHPEQRADQRWSVSALDLHE